jgi:hypothetical protein
MIEERAPKATNPKNPQPPVEPALSPVRFNAVKHGIFSVSPVIPLFESEEDWELFRNTVFAEIQPQGGLQMALADRIATNLWRIMRIMRYEREVITGQIMSVPDDIERASLPPGDVKEQMEGMALRRLLPGEKELATIIRYEGRLHRQLLQTIHQVRLLQGERNLPSGSSLGQPNIDAPATRLHGPEPGAAGYNGGTPHT